MSDRTVKTDNEPLGLRAFAILIGCALPIQVMGRGAIAVVLGLALISFLTLPQKSVYVKRAFDAARSPLGLVMLVLFVFWLPNAFYSIDPLRSLGTGIRPFVFVGLVTLFWAVLVDNTSVHKLTLRALLLASTLAIIAALIAQIALPELYWFLHFKGWVSIDLNAKLKPFASLGILLIPAFIFAGYRLGRVWAFLAAVNSVGMLALILLTQNRASVAGLLGMIVFSAGLAAWTARSRLVRIALPLGVLVVFIAVLTWLHLTRQRVGFGDDWLFPLWLIDYQRQTIWRFAFELVQQNFWFGMGINTINFAPGAEAVIPRTIDLKLIPSHPHNWVLEVAAETGIFGLLSLLGVIFLTFYDNCRAFIRGDGRAYFVAGSLAAGYWVSGLFNFSFWSSWWQMSFVLMTALILSQTSATTTGKKS